MELNKAFSFPSRGHSITLPPRATETHTVIFSPPNAQEEPFEGMIKMTVMQNEYESTRIRLRGVGYLEDLSIEGLPGGSSDEIDFGQLDVLPNANGKQVSFSLQNDQAEVQPMNFQNTMISNCTICWSYLSRPTSGDCCRISSSCSTCT